MQMFLMFSILFHKDILNEEIRLAYLFKDIITLYQGRKKMVLSTQTPRYSDTTMYPQNRF